MALSLKAQQKIHELGQQVPVLSDREIARRLKVSRDAAAKYRGPLPGQQEEADAPDLHIAQQKQIDRLRLENSRLRNINRRIISSGTNTVQDVVDQFKEFLATEKPHRFEFTPKAYPMPRPVKSIFDKNHEEVAVLVLSDWHIGETIRPEESNGVNKFNSIIGANRAYTIIDKFKKLIRGHQTMYKFKSIWLPLLGDFINGTIHPDFILTNDLLDIPSAVLAFRLLKMAIIELKTLGLPIEIDCVVGNHPRLVPQMPAKRQAHLSLDWMIYENLADAFRDDKQVTVRVHGGQFGIVDQLGHRFIIEHGYGAKAGEDLTERLRKMFDSPLYRSATGMEGSSIDCLIIGDKHRSEQGQGYFVNGSLTGQGEYGVMLRLDPITPCQWMFGVSQHHTRTFRYELEVTNVVDESASNPMSEYATQFMAEHGR